MQKTNIEYLTHTWNPIAMRCAPCSPGCENCWHLRTANRLSNNLGIPEDERKALAGEGPCVFRQRELDGPARATEGSVIGTQFMGDLFHDSVPDAYIEAVFEVMYWERRKTFLLLTKRPQRMAGIIHRLEAGKLCAYYDGDESGVEWVTKPFPEVWSHVYHGLTICNQAEADDKIPELLTVPGKKWLSLEPLLGAIDLTPYLSTFRATTEYGHGLSRTDVGYMVPQIDALVLGGETGTGARPMHPDWVRSVRDQCVASGVPFYFKQWGNYCAGCQLPDNIKSVNSGILMDFFGDVLAEDGSSLCSPDSIVRLFPIGSKRASRLLDGREHNELPWAGGRAN